MSTSKGTVFLRLLVLGSPLLLNDFYLFLLPEEADALRMVLDVLVYIFWQSTIIYMAYSARWFTLEDVGITFEDFGKQIFMSVMILAVALILIMAVVLIIRGIEHYFSISIHSNWYYPVKKWHPLLTFLYIFYLSMTAGIFEEVVYRGIAISQLKLVVENKWLIILFSSLFFALIHWSMGAKTLLMAFLLGSFWAYLFIRTGKLLPVIIAHFVYDFLTLYNVHLKIIAFLGINAG